MPLIHYFFWAWLILAVPVFLILLKVKVPFGRHASDEWGLGIPNKWGWFVMELPALFLVSGFYFVWDFVWSEEVGLEFFFVALWTIHYFYRSCIYPFRLRTKGKSMPLAVVAMAFIFNVVNGSFCGYHFSFLAAYPADYVYQWNFVAGLVLFCGGMALNRQADNLLISLRNARDGSYRIPQGSFFRWVSCPNLLGEIVEWCGFALMVWSLPTTAFALWTVANLLPRALAHHQWYLQRFPQYPAGRKAIIPFIL